MASSTGKYQQFPWHSESKDCGSVDRALGPVYMRHEFFHPGVSFIPGWLSSHSGMTFISVSGHLPVSVYMTWPKYDRPGMISSRCWRPGWNHPRANREEIIPGRVSFRDEITHVNGALEARNRLYPSCSFGAERAPGNNILYIDQLQYDTGLRQRELPVIWNSVQSAKTHRARSISKETSNINR